MVGDLRRVVTAAAAAAAAAAGTASLLPSTSPHRLPFPPARRPLAAIPRTLTLTQKPPHLPLPLASSASSPPPPSPPSPEEAETKDPIKLAFARAAAYKKERDSPQPPPPPLPTPPPPQPSAKGSSKEAFVRALDYRNGNGGELGGGSPLFGSSPSSLCCEDGAFGKVGNKKKEYEYDETDFLGLDFFEKKRYKGPPPRLAPVVDPFPDKGFPEVEIIIGDPSKFEKPRRSTEIEPVDDKETKESSRSTKDEPNEDNKLEEARQAVDEPGEDENAEVYEPTVRSWGMFPLPQNISKAKHKPWRRDSSAKEKSAKDKRTRELVAAYRNRQNLIVDAKTKAECSEALKEGDELITAGRLKQALPYYEKVMEAVDFKTELHGMAALQWSICLDSLCRSKEAMSMYSRLKYHPNVEISKKANMFMFSFQAMDFMKVNSSPLPRNTGFETYFDKFGGRKNYYASLDEPGMGINQIIPYMIFLVSPIFLVAFVALRKSLQL